MQFLLFKAHAIFKKLSAIYICTQEIHAASLSPDNVLHWPTDSRRCAFYLGTQNAGFSATLISVGNTGLVVSSDNCLLLAEQQLSSALFKALSLTCWSKEQLEFSNIGGSQCGSEEGFLGLPCATNLGKNLPRKQNWKTLRFYQYTL